MNRYACPGTRVHHRILFGKPLRDHRGGTLGYQPSRCRPPTAIPHLVIEPLELDLMVDPTHRGVSATSLGWPQNLEGALSNTQFKLAEQSVGSWMNQYCCNRTRRALHISPCLAMSTGSITLWPVVDFFSTSSITYFQLKKLGISLEAVDEFVCILPSPVLS